MAKAVDTKFLCQHWIHSREEDTATETVYRPAGFPLPPSRGRPGLKFDPDGTFKQIGIGATDISKVKEGVWKVPSAGADHVCVSVEGQPQRIKILELKQDRMSIARESRAQ
jgi:hypothetical protein